MVPVRLGVSVADDDAASIRRCSGAKPVLAVLTSRTTWLNGFDFGTAGTEIAPNSSEAASGEFEVLDGPATRFGARGDGTSLDVRDPDGATVELRYYS
jgi:hypothetical protein